MDVKELCFGKKPEFTVYDWKKISIEVSLPIAKWPFQLKKNETFSLEE